MSVSLWAYDPDKCDGKACPGDCDNCDLLDWGPDESGLEVGFDPYLGCYTDDC